MSTFLTLPEHLHRSPGFFCIPVAMPHNDGKTRAREGRTFIWNLYADFLVDWERDCTSDTVRP